MDGANSIGIFVRGDTLDAEHVSLFSLVTLTHNLRDVQLSGGPWVKSGVLASSELYQVIAKASGDPPPQIEVFRQMLQTLLADRSNLQVHHVQKNLPIYTLVVNKGGPVFEGEPRRREDEFQGYWQGTLGVVQIVATHMTMQELIDHQLDGYTDRPIFDKTGLAEPYDFVLEFAVENPPPGEEVGPNDSPALVTAVQEQLGLKLEPATAPFDTVVIDHAARPAEN